MSLIANLSQEKFSFDLARKPLPKMKSALYALVTN